MGSFFWQARAVSNTAAIHTNCFFMIIGFGKKAINEGREEQLFGSAKAVFGKARRFDLVGMISLKLEKCNDEHHLSLRIRYQVIDAISCCTCPARLGRTSCETCSPTSGKAQ